MVLALAKPKRVLELGVGKYSTPEFLGCPSLERLVSLETDKDWARQFQDERLTLRLVEDTADAIPTTLHNYDLVFIDNADNAPDRERAIRTVLRREHPVTVIHDAEVPLYFEAIADMAENYIIFNNRLPCTAVCW